MKMQVRRFLAVLMALILISGFSVLSASVYNVNGDVDSFGNDIIDVRDLVRAKKLSAEDPETYNSSFLVQLKRILIGLAEVPTDADQTSSNGSESGAIYLPEVP